MERPAVGFLRVASAPRMMERLQHGDDGSGPRLINRRRPDFLPDFLEVERLHALGSHGSDRRARVAARILALAALTRRGTRQSTPAAQSDRKGS